MGYMTRYDLEIAQDGEVYVHESDAKIMVKEHADYSPWDEECKWYDHEADMKWLSQQYPGTVFMLSGKGEESGDLWRKYFRDGKMQVCKGKVIYPPFDAGMLK